MYVALRVVPVPECTAGIQSREGRKFDGYKAFKQKQNSLASLE